MITDIDFSDCLGEVIKWKPKLVIMDIGLPSFDGFYWCGKIREHSQVPILFLSSRDSDYDKVMGMNMGGDDYMTKPFSSEVLIAKINAMLRRSYNYKVETMDEMTFNGMVLSMNRSTMSFENVVVDLTKNELRILSEQIIEPEASELAYEIERIKHYVNQALHVAKANEASKDLFVEPVLIKPLIYGCIKSYKVFFIQKDLLVEVDEIEDIEIKSDKQWLAYTIGQILHNAVKYSHSSTSILISAKSDEKTTSITISNQGPHIAAHELPKVFTRGFVGSNGRAHKTATGMGMYLSKKMMNHLGGDITVESVEGKYTRFTIHLSHQSHM